LQEYNTIIGKLLSGINRKKFKRIVDKYKGDFAVKKLNCWEQFVSVFLGQITESETLREIVDLIKFHSNHQYHLGVRKDVARSTLAKANEKRDWRIYRDLFLDLVSKLKSSKFYKTTEMVQIIDSTPINLNLTQHPWIETTLKVKGLKTHVVYDLTNKTPVLFDITGARTNDITWAKTIKLEKGITYVMDRGYTDYNWWFEINEKGSFFVTRLKKDAKIENLTEVQSTSEGISSQIFKLTNRHPRGRTKNMYANIPLKKVIVERENKTPLVLVTNDFSRSDTEIAELYKQRWQIELFFKWIKNNLKIKRFLGKSENAIRTQICIAMVSFVF
jgi:IS4 transposase